jgi:hypothetical protein
MIIRKLDQNSMCNRETSRLFSKETVHFIFPPPMSDRCPHSCQYLILSVCLIVAVLVGLKCYLIVVSVCISLCAYDVEHLFTCSLAICISSLEKCLFKSFVPLLNWVV